MNYQSAWMDEDLSIYREAVARFTEKEMLPQDARCREEHNVGHEIWRRAGELGFLCADIPGEYGGGGGDFRHEVVLYEELARRGLSGFGQGVHSIAADSKGNLYTTETYEGKRLQKFVYKGVGSVSPGNQVVLWPKPK